ncbi:MAG: VWA domain-containing protein [Bacteroidota bacterium]|nr:VWA domain-containing protein [Candidatus Kapabacteria bacterium]MDW8219148.1 VWA domain-containing protein [Bacteroidota bacterium]
MLTMLTACPHHVEQMIEKLSPPPGYTPAYMRSSTTSFKEFIAQYKQLLTTSASQTVPTTPHDILTTLQLPSSATLSTVAYSTYPDTTLLRNFPITYPCTVGIPSFTLDSADYDSAILARARFPDSLILAGMHTISLPMQYAEQNPHTEEYDNYENLLPHTHTMGTPVVLRIHSIDDTHYPAYIELHTTVTDTAGRFISGLAPPNFQGTGSYQLYWRTLIDSCPGMTAHIARVRDVLVEEIRESTRDTHAIAFVLDHSPSMGVIRAVRLQEAVARTLGMIQPHDYVTAIKFTSRMHVEVPLTNDSTIYRSQFMINGLQGYGGGTAIYDALLEAMRELRKASSTAIKVIVLFTDGADNRSKSRIHQVYSAAKEQNIQIYSIAYGDTDERPLRMLAKYTGGTMYRLYSTKEFPLAFADVYRSLKNYYRVRYHPPQCASLHTVRLHLVLPEIASIASDTAQYDRSVFTPLDTVGSVHLAHIEFETGKAEIRPESLPMLRDIADYMQRNPHTVMEIRGHTDNRGTPEFNQKLSELRATAVLTALVDMNVPKTRLRAVGFGATQPLVPNDTEQNRQRNRRTEFILVQK